MQRGRRARIVSLPEFVSPSVPCMTRFSEIDPQAPRGECPRMSVPIVGRLRTEWRRWKGQASGRPPRGRAASRRPQVEGLEGRALLASVTEYPVPGLGNSSGVPGQIVKGPDGNLWFTDVDYPRIDEMTPSGKVTV